MKKSFDSESSLFPSFPGYADLMSTLCLVFIVGIAIFAERSKDWSEYIQKLKDENLRLTLELEKQKRETPEVPKKIIIPNELNGRVFFKTCEAIIQQEFTGELDRMMNEVSEELASGRYNFVEIDGHTDKQRIATCAYRDNWELGAARAIATTKYFISHGFDPKILAAVSRAEFSPADIGEDEDAFSKNRRIEIILLRK